MKNGLRGEVLLLFALRTRAHRAGDRDGALWLAMLLSETGSARSGGKDNRELPQVPEDTRELPRAS